MVSQPIILVIPLTKTEGLFLLDKQGGTTVDGKWQSSSYYIIDC